MAVGWWHARRSKARLDLLTKLISITTLITLTRVWSANAEKLIAIRDTSDVLGTTEAEITNIANTSVSSQNEPSSAIELTSIATELADMSTSEYTVIDYNVTLTKTDGSDAIARSAAHAGANNNPYLIYNSSFLGFTAAFVIIIGIVGTLGNLLAAVSLLQSQQLRKSPSTAFMVNLPVCLLPVCALGLPIFAVGCIQIQWYQRVLMPEWFCVLGFTLGLTFSQVHLHTLGAIAFNRLIAVVLPCRYRQLMQARVVKVYLVLLWLYSAALWLPLGFTTLKWQPEELMVSMSDNSTTKIKKAIHIFLTYIWPIVITSTCYIVMYVKMRQSRRRCRSRPDDSSLADGGEAVKQWDDHVTRTIRVLFVLLLACSVPHLVVHLLHLHRKHPLSWLLLHLVFWMQFCLDPIIYVLMSQQYRRACLECLERIFPFISTFRVNEESATRFDPKADTSSHLLQGGKYEMRKSQSLAITEGIKTPMLATRAKV